MATRREKVILELQDDFTSGMARAAAATAVLDRNLNSLSGRAVSTNRSVRSLGDSTDRLDTSTRRGGDSINQFSGRLALMAQAAAALGPALVPISAVAVPAITSLSAGLASAAGAAGVALLAFNGMGDALKALDAYQLEPTTANLDKMRVALDELGPAGADFARFFDGLDDQFQQLQDIAGAGLFPGLEQGIRDLLPLLPQVQSIVGEIAATMGDLAVEAAGALNNERFQAFFDYLESDAAPTLAAFASATGNVLEGLASLTVAFAPLTQSFTSGMQEMAQSFADWAANLSQTDGFRDFIDYVRASGPQVLDTLGALSTAFIEIAQAAAPIGGPVLKALEAVADAIATIASSDIGTPLVAAAVAMSTLSRAAALTRVAMASTWGASRVSSIRAAGVALGTVTSAQDRARLSAQQLAVAERERSAAVRAGFATTAKAIGVAGGLAIAAAGVADSVGYSNTASLALMGTLAGPWGAAVGAGIGLTMDFAAANNGLEAAVRGANAALDSMDTTQLQASLDVLNQQIDDAKKRATVDFSWNPFQMSKENLDAFRAGVNELSTGTEAAAEAKRKDVEAALADAAANDRLAAANGVVARVARITRSQIAGATAAMEENRKAALGAFDAVTQYGNALDAARKQAKASNAGLSASTEEGRKNRDALSQLAAAWNNQGDAIRNNVGKWREARKNFIDTAAAMGAPIERARELANRLLEIPQQRVVEIKLYGSEQAAGQIARIRQELQSIPRTWSTTYYVNQVNSVSRRAAGGRDGDPSTPQADGGTVPKTGRPYADRHHYLLADGEEVISNRRGQADRYRPLLKAINNAADGATVGRRPSFFSEPGEVTRGSSVGDAVAAIADLRLTIRGLNKDIRESDKTIRQETRQRDKLADKVDKSQAKLDRINGLYDDLAGSIGSGLAANQFDIGNAWKTGGGLPAILEKLRASTANADAFTTASSTLSGQLSGAALESVLRQGLGTVQQFAGLPPEMLAQYQAAFDQNATAVAATGAAGAAGVYGADRAAAEAGLAAAQADLAKQTAELRAITQQNAIAEKQRDRAEKILGQVKDILGDLRTEARKARGEAESGTRSKR